MIKSISEPENIFLFEVILAEARSINYQNHYERSAIFGPLTQDWSSFCKDQKVVRCTHKSTNK
jgi:hypothetical protein